jgi:hypothetical protein
MTKHELEEELEAVERERDYYRQRFMQLVMVVHDVGTLIEETSPDDWGRLHRANALLKLLEGLETPLTPEPV